MERTVNRKLITQDGWGSSTAKALKKKEDNRERKKEGEREGKAEKKVLFSVLSTIPHASKIQEIMASFACCINYIT